MVDSASAAMARFFLFCFSGKTVFVFDDLKWHWDTPTMSQHETKRQKNFFGHSRRFLSPLNFLSWNQKKWNLDETYIPLIQRFWAALAAQWYGSWPWPGEHGFESCQYLFCYLSFSITISISSVFLNRSLEKVQPIDFSTNNAYLWNIKQTTLYEHWTEKWFKAFTWLIIIITT